MPSHDRTYTTQYWFWRTPLQKTFACRTAVQTLELLCTSPRPSETLLLYSCSVGEWHCNRDVLKYGLFTSTYRWTYHNLNNILHTSTSVLRQTLWCASFLPCEPQHFNYLIHHQITSMHLYCSTICKLQKKHNHPPLHHKILSISTLSTSTY